MENLKSQVIDTEGKLWTSYLLMFECLKSNTSKINILVMQFWFCMLVKINNLLNNKMYCPWSTYLNFLCSNNLIIFKYFIIGQSYITHGFAFFLSTCFNYKQSFSFFLWRIGRWVLQLIFILYNICPLTLRNSELENID